MTTEDEYFHDLTTLEVRELFRRYGIDTSKLDLYQIEKLMDKFQNAMQIKKIGEDSYEVKNRARNVDEEVDSSQLFGILNREQLIGPTADEVMRSLEEHTIGYEITIRYLKRS
jgi:hypothetical protein